MLYFMLYNIFLIVGLCGETIFVVSVMSVVGGVLLWVVCEFRHVGVRY